MLRDYLELIRVPSVFTAPADVMMGFFFVTPVALFDARGALALGLLITASCLLYSAGMVLNDVCDYREDCRDRPERPLPSGRIALAAARRFGWGLLVAGWAMALLATWWTSQWGPAICGSGLSVLILRYNAHLKRHAVAGPVTMGACRALNVLLGMSVATGWEPDRFQVAGVIGLFIVGVSVMARGEADRSRRAPILLGIVLMMAAVGALWWLPEVRPILVQTSHWRLFVVLMAMLVAWRCSRAVLDPSPGAVQQAVTQSIRSLIVLDAVVTLAVAGPVPAVAVLLLLVPNMVLSRWFYTT